MPTAGVEVAAPDVAVIVTSLNRARLLRLALRSVQLQDLDRWECIVVDDGSLDDSVVVAQSFASIDPRFRVVRHDRNRGLSAARNTGLAEARAPLVCFLDDDDLLLQSSLSSRLGAMAGQPADVAGAFCDWVGIDPEDRLGPIARRRAPRALHAVHYGDLAAGAPFISSSPLLHTDVLRSLRGFDEALARAEDVDMWMRVTRAGYRFVYSNSVGIGYRRTPGSMVIGSPEIQFDCMMSVLHSADLPASSGAPLGTNADHRPISAAAFELAYAPQVLHHLALLSTQSVERAIAAGTSRFSQRFRQQLDVDRYLTTLTPSVNRRLGRHAPAEVETTRRHIKDLLDGLSAPTPNFAPPQIDASWLDEAQRRGRLVVPRPTLVSDRLKPAFDGAVLLVAEARYHVDELGPLHDELVRRGVNVRFMDSPFASEPTYFALGEYVDEILPFRPDLTARASAVVVLNDWGSLKPLLESANDAGIATFAKVEGVQDFGDVDTSRPRRAYRTAAIVLGQGENDATALPGRDVRIVGSSRLERIWLQPAVAPGDHALVNLNFTFSVLTSARTPWIRSVEHASRRAGIEATISCHPAERPSGVRLPISPNPFRYDITRAGLLVSRFSTVLFEAMARGVPVVYHNPHGERVPTFTRPDGAFLVSTTADELADAMGTALTWRDGYRERAEAFFRGQVDVCEQRPSELRAADVILGELDRDR
jgi:hypothetical protein